MQKKTKAIIVIVLIVALLLAGAIIYWETHYGNRSLIDTKYRFDYAIIRLPNGETVEGKVSSWTDFSDSDVVQITIKGKTYLTSYVNACLINE
ncbi:MAG: hypothetical protein IJJ45_12040 [Clostridia bacterium]|nr:hypothetical protein [Clostridia bacterium]